MGADLDDARTAVAAMRHAVAGDAEAVGALFAGMEYGHVFRCLLVTGMQFAGVVADDRGVDVASLLDGMLVNMAAEEAEGS